MKRPFPFLAAILTLFTVVFACSDDPKKSDESNTDTDAAIVQDDASTDVDDASSNGSDDASTEDTSDASEEDGDAGVIIPSSGGSGGLDCTSTGSANLPNSGGTIAYCVTTVSGSELKIYAPDPLPEHPLTFALFVHGDGATTHTNNTSLRFHGAWVKQHDILYVSARAPNGCSWWLPPTPVFTDCNATLTGGRDITGQNADVLRDIVEAVRNAWDIDDRRILFGGASGGSIQLTGSFLPRHGAEYPGFYALMCGGEVPWQSMDWDVSNPALRATTELSFVYGDQDYLFDDIQDCRDHYTALDLPVAEQVIEDAGHCTGYSQLDKVIEVWDVALLSTDE